VSENPDGAMRRVATVLAWLGMLCASLGLDVNEKGREELQCSAAPGRMRHTGTEGGARESLEVAAEGTGHLEQKACCERTMRQREAARNEVTKGRAVLGRLPTALAAAQVDWFLEMCWEDRPVVFRKSMAVESTSGCNETQAMPTILEVTQSMGSTETVAASAAETASSAGPRAGAGQAG